MNKISVEMFETPFGQYRIAIFSTRTKKLFIEVTTSSKEKAKELLEKLLKVADPLYMLNLFSRDPFETEYLVPPVNIVQTLDLSLRTKEMGDRYYRPKTLQNLL